MRDGHTHCSCNLVRLCTSCHTWAHAHPFEAKAAGWIVLRSVSEPGTVEVSAFLGTVKLSCEGTYTTGEKSWVDELMGDEE